MLSEKNIIGFIPSTNLNKSRIFYEEVLGLQLLSIDEYVIEFKSSCNKLRIIKVDKIPSTEYTKFGWEVSNIIETTKEMRERGINFIKYEGMPQDDDLICTFSTSKVVWFKDSDMNTLSLTQNI